MSDGSDARQLLPDREVKLRVDVVKEKYDLPVVVREIIIGIDFAMRLHIHIHSERVIVRHPQISGTDKIFQGSDVQGYLVVVHGIV
jgi:hypothetical protein